jgi:hypothetical protein
VLSKSEEIKIYETIILAGVLYRCGTWSWSIEFGKKVRNEEIKNKEGK